MKNQGQIYGLTIFRFVAAFYVFIFHCNIRFPVKINDTLDAFVGNGAIGLSFFFVLSGFVLSWTSRDGIDKNYLYKRFIRIYPAYLLLGIITVPYLTTLPPYRAWPSVFLFLTGTQSWIPQSFYLWNFIGSWSVSTEIFFYAIFPIIYIKAKEMTVTFLLLSILSTSLLLPFSVLIGAGHQFPNYYVTPIYRLPEFVVGVCSGILFSKGIRLGKSLALLLLVLSFLVFIFASPIKNIAFMYTNVFTVPATAILIFSLASLNIKKTLLSTPFIYLGKISYSFYLMQIPILMYVEHNKHTLDALSSYESWAVLFIANMIMAMLSYHFVENLALRKLRPILSY